MNTKDKASPSNQLISIAVTISHHWTVARRHKRRTINHAPWVTRWVPLRRWCLVLSVTAPPSLRTWFSNSVGTTLMTARYPHPTSQPRWWEAREKPRIGHGSNLLWGVQQRAFIILSKQAAELMCGSHGSRGSSKTCPISWYSWVCLL